MKIGILTILAAAAAMAAGAALAEKPSWAGEGKGKGKGQAKKEMSGKGAKHFTADHRVFVKEYYADEFRAGRCPPGLAKKRNGCMPPGHKYVRVASDILLIAVGTAMVVEAIDDLARL